ncbi:MAG: MoaD/ThiS family protein [Candidatus Lokiarchaeota archaeon]|nr:MoaD/ThiS family protein [Candidatus Lokiarchaeota archaeon]
MIVEILYFAEFKDITRKEKEKFEISDSNLMALLNILFEKYELKSIIWDEKNQKIHSLISIIINNQAIHEKDPLLIDVSDGDTIAFLLPVSGG